MPLCGRSGLEKCRFSMPLLMTRCRQIDLPKSKLNTELCIFCCTGRQNVPNCTDLHPYLSFRDSCMITMECSRSLSVSLVHGAVISRPRNADSYIAALWQYSAKLLAGCVGVFVDESGQKTAGHNHCHCSHCGTAHNSRIIITARIYLTSRCRIGSSSGCCLNVV